MHTSIHLYASFPFDLLCGGAIRTFLQSALNSELFRFAAERKRLLTPHMEARLNARILLAHIILEMSYDCRGGKGE